MSEIRKRAPSWASPILALAFVFVTIMWVEARSEPMPERRYDGFNVIVTPGYPFGSASADLALANAKQLGASAVAVIPFLWQPSPNSPDLVRGKDMDDDELRAAIREAHALGLAVLVKPHVWVPQSWAGAIVMHSDADWRQWFANYRARIDAYRAGRRGGESRRARDRHRAFANDASGRNGTT